MLGDWALLHKSAAVNFDDFCFLFAQWNSESLLYIIDYKSDRIIPRMHKKYF